MNLLYKIQKDGTAIAIALIILFFDYFDFIHIL